MSKDKIIENLYGNMSTGCLQSPQNTSLHLILTTLQGREPVDFVFTEEETEILAAAVL